MALRFDKLVSAISRAALEAQNHIQRAHIGDLHNYFDSEGKPISVKLSIPRRNHETGRDEFMEVNVPLITLVSPSQMSIKEMQVTMQIDLSALDDDTPQSKETRRQAKYKWTHAEQEAPLAAATAVGKPGAGNTAQITLRVAAEETSEGLARLLVHLNKSL
ncbi:MAG: DUF2589 domain-containing protein [Candidatus Ferrigenium altingense]